MTCQTCGGTSWVGSPDNHRYPPHLRSDTECPDCMDPALPEVPLCRYCDRLPDCAHICDRCMSEASAEQAAQIPDDYDPFHDYELEDFQ